MDGQSRPFKLSKDPIGESLTNMSIYYFKLFYICYSRKGLLMRNYSKLLFIILIHFMFMFMLRIFNTRNEYHGFLELDFSFYFRNVLQRRLYFIFLAIFINIMASASYLGATKYNDGDSLRVYSSPPPITCGNITYNLVNATFPFAVTGSGGFGLGLSSVSNPANTVDANLTNFATITTVIGVGGFIKKIIPMTIPPEPI